MLFDQQIEWSRASSNSVGHIQAHFGTSTQAKVHLRPPNRTRRATQSDKIPHRIDTSDVSSEITEQGHHRPHPAPIIPHPAKVHQSTKPLKATSVISPQPSRQQPLGDQEWQSRRKEYPKAVVLKRNRGTFDERRQECKPSSAGSQLVRSKIWVCRLPSISRRPCVLLQLHTSRLWRIR